MTATRNPPTNQTKKPKQKNWLVGMVGVGCWCGWVILLFLFVLPFLSSLVLCVFACRFLFWDKKQKEQRCDCSVRRSVGGIQLAAQRCFCRQRSYQRDHARSRLALIAEAKPVWARSVLPWVTRWESRVMLLSFFFFFSTPSLSSSSLFSLSFSSCLLLSDAHTRSLLHLVGWLVGSFGWLVPSLPPHTHTHTLTLLSWVCSCCCCLHTHTHARTLS